MPKDNSYNLSSERFFDLSVYISHYCLFVVYYVVVNCLYMVHLLHTNIHILYKDLPQIY